MSAETSARHALPFLATGQAQKELTHNEALALIDAGLHPAVEQHGLDTPPTAPTAGQCWIVGATPVGAWTDHAQALACWTMSGWRFLDATEGMTVWSKDLHCWIVREAAGWIAGNVRAARLVIGGQQVVAARQPAVPAPTGGATVDAEARAAIQAILLRLSGHGLIEG